MGIIYPPKKVRKKFKKHAFGISLDVFKLDIGVFFDPEDLIYYGNKVHNIDVDLEDFSTSANAEAGYITNENGLPYFYILFNSENPPIGIVAHEAVHVAIVVCDRLGIPVQKDTDETLAYMVDYLVQNIVDEIRYNMHK